MNRFGGVDKRIDYNDVGDNGSSSSEGIKTFFLVIKDSPTLTPMNKGTNKTHSSPYTQKAGFKFNPSSGAHLSKPVESGIGEVNARGRRNVTSIVLDVKHFFKLLNLSQEALKTHKK